MKKFGLLQVILIIAFVVRIVLLDQSFWLDEAAQALESMRPLKDQLRIPYDFQPPLFHLVVHLFAQISIEEWWLRLSSVFSGIIVIIATYLTATQLFLGEKGKKIGILAASFLAISSLHVFFSQELRQYMFAAMWGSLSWLSLVLYMNAKKRSYVFAFGAATAAGLYSMYVYPFLLFSQLVYVLFLKRTMLKPVILATLGSAIAFLPWIPSFLEQLRIGTALRVALPGWSEVVSSPQWKALPLVWLKFLGGVQEINFDLFSAVYFGVLSLGAVFVLINLFKADKKQRKPILLLTCWFGVSVMSAWLISFIVPVISVKRVLFALPAFFLLLSAGIYTLPSKGKQKVFIVGFLTLQLLGLCMYWFQPSLQREGWRDIHETIYDNYSREQTVIVFGFNEPFAPWIFYDQSRQVKFSTISFPYVRLRNDTDFEAQMNKVLPYKTVLIFDYLRDLTDENRLIEQWLEQHGYQGVASIDTRNIGFIRQYDRIEFISLR